jgi:heterodisulfide reductase subunit C/nitrate reductase gamma subunit
LLGIVYRVWTWFSRNLGLSAKNFTTSERISAAAKGISGTVFSAKILTLVKVFVLDVLLQRRILKEDFLRWLMHMFIYVGFMLLLLMHALEKFISEPLFANYYSTVNPFMFLRDLFGFMVIVGICIAIFRRFILRVPRLKTNAMDHYAIVILVVIMMSGVFLEAVKITSITEFMYMVEDYAGMTLDDYEEDIRALESYWVQDFGLVSPNVQAPFDEDELVMGQDVHMANCMGCHAKPQWAFTGYTVAKIIKPIAPALDQADAVNILWYIHFIACFIGLAYLPFSKMFHIFSTPVSLLANAVMDNETSAPANIATRRVMELDACMHCGTCSLRCSASSAFDVLGNDNILPAEKMISLKKLVKRKSIGPETLRVIQEGVYLCTNCDRCTVVCPAGINLKDLWINVREDLIQRGYPEPLTLSPFSFFRGLIKGTLATNDYAKPLEKAKAAVAGNFEELMDQEKPISFADRQMAEPDRIPGLDTFSYCFSCQTCTTVCPVVACFEDPGELLGLLPHQIMNCLGMGLVEMASGPKMLWDCITCYQCQESCPQNVEVTDIIFQLKNIAVDTAGKQNKEITADVEI